MTFWVPTSKLAAACVSGWGPALASRVFGACAGFRATFSPGWETGGVKAIYIFRDNIV